MLLQNHFIKGRLLTCENMILVFLAPGFEESEAICPIDILKRAALDVVTVSITEDREVTGAHGITVRADVTLSQLPLCHPEAILLPGGMPGTRHLDESRTVDTALRVAANKGAYLAAICAAPMVLGKRGYLSGKRATCFPGFEEFLQGATVTGRDERVVRDGKIITAAGMGVALEFGLALVAALKGEDAAEELRRAVLAD